MVSVRADCFYSADEWADLDVDHANDIFGNLSDEVFDVSRAAEKPHLVRFFYLRHFCRQAGFNSDIGGDLFAPFRKTRYYGKGGHPRWRPFHNPGYRLRGTFVVK